jgi:hypothetical protein
MKANLVSLIDSAQRWFFQLVLVVHPFALIGIGENITHDISRIAVHSSDGTL